MKGEDTLNSINESWLSDSNDSALDEQSLALVIVWSFEEPGRVGETAPIPGSRVARLLGRGEASVSEKPERLRWFRQRPGRLEPRGPLTSRGISRRQLVVNTRGTRMQVEKIGRCPMAINGLPTESGVLEPGDTLTLRKQLILLCVRRPLMFPEHEALQEERTPFGRADPHGIVGESYSMWNLRSTLEFVASQRGHVLVTGESGTGKELVSRAIHRCSNRGARPLVSRNAATFPPGLVDAELFGNIKNYPNPGTEARKGLIGEADGSSLLLDEIGELPSELQAHLLRCLDCDGSYQRLGESKPQRSDFRFIAATNRDPEALRPDFLSRLALHVDVPGLNDRREDIPLLVHHLLKKIAEDSREIAERLFEDGEPKRGWPRVSPLLMDALIRHDYTHHTRELERHLWTAIGGCHGHHLALTDELRQQLSSVGADQHDPTSLSLDAIQATLAAHDGNLTRAADELGLNNRHVLRRLLKKHGLR